MSQMCYILAAIKGAGGSQGSEVDFEFFIDSDRGECKLPGTFFGL